MTDKTADGRLRVNLKKILKPELINRFDEVIIFRRLSKEDQFRVLDILLKDIVATLKLQKIKLTVTQHVKNHIIKVGYSEEYGARALRRMVEKELLDKIAEFLLKHRGRPLDLIASVEANNIVILNK